MPTHKRISLAIMLFLAMTIPAHSADWSRILLWTGSTADITTTRIGLTRYGMREGNPLIGNHRMAAPIAIIGSGVGIDLYAGKMEPKSGRKLRIVVGALHFTAASWNVYMMRRNRP